MTIRRTALALLAASLVASVSAAQTVETWRIDPVHSSVQFRIRHFFSKVPGQFKDFEGTLTVDRDDMTRSKVEAVIKTASVDTKNEKRDGDLRSTNFFDVERYPTMTFKSTAWRRIEKDVYDVTGNLTLHGTTKPVTLRVKAGGSGPDAWGGYRSGWEATTTLDRTAFGVSWNKAIEGGGMMLGNEVEITLEVEAVREAPKAK